MQAGHSASTEKKTPIPRPRKACTTCRGLKTRCLPDDDNIDPTARCSRCARLGLTCIYARARRGRPPRGATSQPSLINTHDPHNHSHSHSQPSSANASGRMMWDMRGGVQVPSHPVASSSLPGSANPGSTTNGMMPPAPVDMLSTPWSSLSGPGVATLVHTSPPGMYESSGGSLDPKSPPNMHDLGPPIRNEHPHRNSDGPSLGDYLEPDMGLEGSHRPPPAAPRPRMVYPTPIETGLMDEPEAKILFKAFIDNISPCGGLFDPIYHTYDRVRQSSPLFTAVIATACRFFRPDICLLVESLADTLISRAFMQGDYDLQFIQALLVLVYWRRKEDRTTYAKVGLACRLVAGLRIHFPSRDPVPTTEEEHRRQLDHERTLFNAVSMDLWYAIILQLPPNGALHLPQVDTVMEWASKNQRYAAPGDSFKAFISGLWDIQKEFAGAHFDLEEAVQFGSWNYEAKHARLVDHLRFWIGNSSLQGSHAKQAEVIGKITLLKLRIIGLLQKQDGKANCGPVLSLAEEIGGVIEGAADLMYWFDISCCLLPMPGILLHNARKHFNNEEYSRAKNFCLRMSRTFYDIGNFGAGDSTMQGISRFYQRLNNAFDRGKTGSDDPHVASAIQNILHNVPHWSPLVNVVTEPLIVENNQPTDWVWVAQQQQAQQQQAQQQQAQQQQAQQQQAAQSRWNSGLTEQNLHSRQ